MDITIKGKNVHVGDALQTHITKALSDHLTRYFDRSLEAHATLSKEAGEFTVDLALHVPGEILAAHASAEDPYVAYDAASAKLFAQVKKYKSRIRDHHKEDGQKHNGMADKAVSA